MGPIGYTEKSLTTILGWVTSQKSEDLLRILYLTWIEKDIILKAIYPQKLALTSPTGGGRSVGIVRSRTKATEFSFIYRNSCVTDIMITHVLIQFSPID